MGWWLHPWFQQYDYPFILFYQKQNTFSYLTARTVFVDDIYEETQIDITITIQGLTQNTFSFVTANSSFRDDPLEETQIDITITIQTIIQSSVAVTTTSTSYVDDTET